MTAMTAIRGIRASFAFRGARRSRGGTCGGAGGIRLVAPRRPWLGIAVALLFASPSGSEAQDPPAYDAVWQLLYGIDAEEFPPHEDFDGDGASNLEESRAGTDPRNPEDLLRVVETETVDGALRFTVPSKAGKRYRLLRSTSPGGPGWTPVGEAQSGTGSLIQFEAGADSAERGFFRVAVEDQDSDGDGVSDWAEAVLGTDPYQSHSPTNASGGVASDGETLASLLSLSVETIDSSASELEGTPAVLRLSRSEGAMPLAVPFEIFGAAPAPGRSAAAPSDYSLSGNAGSSLLIPAGEGSADLEISATANSLRQVPRYLRVAFRLPAPTPLQLGVEAEARVVDALPVEANRRLFVAYLTPAPGVATTAAGTATVLVEGDNDTALVNLAFSNLSSEQNTAYLRTGENLELSRIPNGQVSGHQWNLGAASILVTDQAMLDALENGLLHIAVSSANHPGGEIRGTLQAASGSVEPPPEPPAPPDYGSEAFPNLAADGVEDNFELDRDIARFLMQASFGPTEALMEELRQSVAAAGNQTLAGYAAWIDRQMSTAPGDAPSPSLEALVRAADLEEFLLRGNAPVTSNNDPQFGGNSTQFNAASGTWGASSIHQGNHPFSNNRRREWWTLVLNSRDQLRQRVAFALSEIAVISELDGVVLARHYGTAAYWDHLAALAFGSYRAVLEEVTYSPMMGVYLSHLKNQKRSGSISPDENYAREIMQLFSIGLVQRHLDGSLVLDAATGLPIPTYDQEDITELARVLTGLSFGRRNALVAGAPTYPNPTSQWIGPEQDNPNFFQNNGHRFWQASWTNRMKMFASYHDFDEYTAHTGRPLPEGVSSASKILFRGKPGQKVVPVRSQSAANGDADIRDALDALADHPNTPVFVSRLLIQRLTSSNPSAGYLRRVATVFRDSGGDLGQVVKAILLDYEARVLPGSGAGGLADSPGHGKVKEPLLHFAALIRALEGSTGAPLEHLATMPVPFTSAQAPQTSPYPAGELAKFPAGTTRFRWQITDAPLGQTPQRAPSVFNWFLPDYVVPGPLAAAGLVAPELQIATESGVISAVNHHQSLVFTSTPPSVITPANYARGIRYGRGLDNFLNLSAYRDASGNQRSVPAYALPDDPPGSNPGGRGYFLKAQFDPGEGEVPESINDQPDNLNPDYGPLKARYTAAYLASLQQQYGGSVPAAPGTSQKVAAHAAAAEAVLDRVDLLLAAGTFKARYGVAAGDHPRGHIVEALASTGNRTYHTNHGSYELDMVNRIKAVVYLVSTSPQALVLR